MVLIYMTSYVNIYFNFQVKIFNWKFFNLLIIFNKSQYDREKFKKTDRNYSIGN
jgi:hypothetical protein